jgi:predicted nucleic-acid-binding Zn-ribbon protein
LPSDFLEEYGMWKCKKCGERIEDSFVICWNCGTSRDGLEGHSFQKPDGAETEQAEGIMAAHPPAPSSASPYRTRQRQAQSACPKCGSRQVIPTVRVLDRDGEYTDKSLSVRLDRNPEAWIFKGSEVVELTARVCGRCGYAELYATSCAALWSAYEEQVKGLSG